MFSYCCLYFFLFTIWPPLFYCLLYLLHLFHSAILSQYSVHSFLPCHSFNHLLPIALHISSTRSIGPSTIYSLRSNNIFLLPSAFLPFASFEQLSAAFLSTFRSFSSFIYFCFVTLDVALLYNFIFSLLQAAFYLKLCLSCLRLYVLRFLFPIFYIHDRCSFFTMRHFSPIYDSILFYGDLFPHVRTICSTRNPSARSILSIGWCRYNCCW